MGACPAPKSIAAWKRCQAWVLGAHSYIEWDAHWLYNSDGQPFWLAGHKLSPNSPLVSLWSLSSRGIPDRICILEHQNGGAWGCVPHTAAAQATCHRLATSGTGRGILIRKCSVKFVSHPSRPSCAGSCLLMPWIPSQSNSSALCPQLSPQFSNSVPTPAPFFYHLLPPHPLDPQFRSPPFIEGPHSLLIPQHVE